MMLGTEAVTDATRLLLTVAGASAADADIAKSAAPIAVANSGFRLIIVAPLSCVEYHLVRRGRPDHRKAPTTPGKE